MVCKNTSEKSLSWSNHDFSEKPYKKLGFQKLGNYINKNWNTLAFSRPFSVLKMCYNTNRLGFEVWFCFVLNILMFNYRKIIKFRMSFKFRKNT